MTRYPARLLLTLISMLLWHSASAIDSDCGGPGSPCTPFTAEEKEQILKKHNDLRASLARGELLPVNMPAAADMNQLVWDEGLAAIAQAYAETCPLGGNPSSDVEYLAQRNAGNTRWGDSDPEDQFIPGFPCSAGSECLPVGENIYLDASILTIDAITLNGIEIGWWNEHLQWLFSPYGTLGTCAGSSCDNFTQLAWANTRYVGCGYANGCSGSGFNVLVCNYFPTGNFVSFTPYTQADQTQACTQCLPDREICTDGQCGGPTCPTIVDGGTFTPQTADNFDTCIPGSTDLSPPSGQGATDCDEYDGCAIDSIDWVDFELGEDGVCFEASRTPNAQCDTVGDADFDGIPNGVDNCVNVANADQLDTDADGFGNICDADLDQDCVINFLDLGLMKSVFFSADPDADMNGDGAVNFVDLGLMKTAFFSEPGPSGLESNICNSPPVPLDVSVTYTVSGAPGLYTYNFTITNNSNDPIDVYSFAPSSIGLTWAGAPPGWGQGLFAPVQWCTNGDCFGTTGGIMPGESLSDFVALDVSGTSPQQIPYTIAIVGPTVPSLDLPNTSGDTAAVEGVATAQ
ncbi:MAG: CAP domain-containing protein [Pseudomonadota bacterium]